MADNSRIEDLRKRYHENPRRFFAPLANEYRKSGLLDRALLLCQKHVPEQPENMNGLVVFGQTLFELGQHDAAREPFESALRLDPENLIALRHLGDIARLLGDVPTARGWYEKVLELDRRNDEVLDLMSQMGADDAATEAPSARPSATASGLISVAPTVSVSGAEDVGTIDLGAASPPPPPRTSPSPKAPAGKGGTVVINAQALADRDRQEAEESRDAQPAPPPPAAAPAPRPSKRASLLDLEFDFSEMAEVEAPSSFTEMTPLGAEAAEYGLAAMEVVEPTVPVTAPAPEAVPAPETVPAPAAELPAGDFELAEFSAEVSPLAGLEATEFTSEQVAPMAELEPDSVSMSLPSVVPLDGLDRPDVTVDAVAPVEGLSDIPLLDEPAAADADTVSAPEPSSAHHRPRMTRADLSSLPLLADFGLEDEPVAAEATTAPEAPEPPAPSVAPEIPASPRASKATPTFATETMAALYVQQGLFAEAIAVYEQLIEAAPADAGLTAKLAELQRMYAQQQTPAAASASEEMPEFDAPTESVEPEPAPANAAMADVSFGEIALRGQGSATPIVTPAVPAGPTAREFFGGFARRAASAASAAEPAAAAHDASSGAYDADADVEPPTVASAPVGQWPLDALFGAASDVRDLHAAETIAGVGTFDGPDGGTGIGEILVGAAPKRQVPRASETLKFDQFFQKPGTASAAGPEAAAAPGDDDLDQFQDWLKGLKT